MKKFSFLMVDDEGDKSSTTGWYRVVKFLNSAKYLKCNNFYPNNWGNEEYFVNNNTMRYAIFSSENNKTFEHAKDDIKETFNSFDMLFMDLKFDKNKPFVNNSNCTIKNLVVEDIDISDIKEGQIPDYLAGMDLINLLPQDSMKPKFIFSGADETKSFIGYTKLLSNRFTDIFFARYHEGMEGLEILIPYIDSYLKKRQTETCQRQSVDTIKKLKEIIKSCCRDNCESCDIELIPDNPNIDDSEKWSLRTLFPKQINSIEENIEVEKNKQYILDVLEADWRKLMSIGILNHPNDPKGCHWDIEKAKQLVKCLDFQKEDKVNHYKQIIDIPKFDDNIQCLRDYIINDYKIAYHNSHSNISKQPEHLQNVKEYFNSLTLCENANKGNNWWYTKLVSMCQNYGVYPLDIAYISHIAYQNSEYNRNKPCFSPIIEDKDYILFIWNYPESANQDIFKENSKLYGKLKQSNDEPESLSDSGFSDISKIVCWRYRGMVELRSGCFGIRAIRDLTNDYIANEINNNNKIIKTELDDIIKVLSIKFNDNINGTSLRISINKP